jgi:hypothetical protein
MARASLYVCTDCLRLPGPVMFSCMHISCHTITEVYIIYIYSNPVGRSALQHVLPTLV